jgi:hypothetical protein
MYNPWRHRLRPGRAKTSRKEWERSNAQVDCRCLCSDLGVISTGFATRIPPTARKTGHSSPRSMRRRYAPREWCLRENSRPPCRQQVRSRSDLLGHGTSWTPGLETQQGEVGDRPMTETFGPASIRWPDVAYWTEAGDPVCPHLSLSRLPGEFLLALINVTANLVIVAAILAHASKIGSHAA